MASTPSNPALERWSTRLLVAQAISLGFFFFVIAIERYTGLLPPQSTVGEIALGTSLGFGVIASLAAIGAWFVSYRARWLLVPMGATGLGLIGLLVVALCCARWA